MTRIAFIGGGPKTLFALLELKERCSEAVAKSLHVEVFDPYPPGAGRVWQAGQPKVLRLNVAARIVDAGLSPGSEPFADWVARVEPQYGAERYPPRAVVGRYLQEQFELLARTARFKLTHVPAQALGVARAGQQWEVHSEAGNGSYDEVVLATGHGLASDRSGTKLASACNRDPLIGQYLELGEETIPAGSHVLIRGAALTAYDVVLLLTEGRGGRWDELEGPNGRSLRYVPAGREPAKITMASLSALPMDPKAEQVPEPILSCIDSYRPTLREWGRSLAACPDGAGAGYNEMWRILLSCAVECARLYQSPVTPLALWRTALTGRPRYDPGCESAQENGSRSAAEHIRTSIAVNRQHAAPSTQWLWARVWSGLYPEVVQAVSRAHWQPAQSRVFRRVSKQLERMAFGPPEHTALKMLALFDSGLLEQGRFTLPPPQNTVLVNAVTPSAGVLTAPSPEGQAMSPLIGGLLAAGEIFVRQGERGLLTDEDGTCIDAQGNRNESLAALGRPTEGPTLGHDTLNRTLHTEHRAWAQRIARQRVPEHVGKRS